MPMKTMMGGLENLATGVLARRKRPYLMAHRGNRVLCPENTMAAFRQSFEDGAAILETDLHVTRDGVMVCIHDATVDRTTDGEGEVAAYSLEEIKLLKANRGFEGFESERIPTLEELAAILPDNVALALELKSDAFLDEEICRQLASILEDSGVRQQTLVISFSMERLRTVRRVAADIPIGLISLSSLFPSAEPEFVGVLWPMLFANPFYVWMAHRRGQFFCPLDPEPDSRLWYYRFLNCDSILSDNPAVTKRKLNQNVDE